MGHSFLGVVVEPEQHEKHLHGNLISSFWRFECLRKKYPPTIHSGKQTWPEIHLQLKTTLAIFVYPKTKPFIALGHLDSLAVSFRRHSPDRWADASPSPTRTREFDDSVDTFLLVS